MKLLTEPYQHQNKAVKKLLPIKVGALYMEMGTGKTRTALEFVKYRLETGRITKVLWLCPCSVKINLYRDILKHTPDTEDITICGIETLSSSIKTNAELLRFVKKEKVFLIVDESNLVKNHQAKRTQNIIRLAQYCKYKMILNGTPLSRNEKDLFSQWYILDYRILGYKSFWSFAANHLEYDERIRGRIVKCLNTDYLVSKISPYSYQVKKSECLDLPEKTYETVYYELSYEQYDHYFKVADMLLFQLDEFKPYTIYRFLSGVQSVIAGRYVTEEEERLKTKPFFSDSYENPRINKLIETVNKIDHKIIIFCKYTHEIKELVKVLNDQYSDDTALPFYGELKQKERQLNLDLFENQARFLVANKVCAGYGLNLQFCKYVIYYSNDWDYATRSQSEDRVHRIGQTENVHIIDICAHETLDERILNCLIRKENLVDKFKSELEQQKDKDFVKSFIFQKDSTGRSYQKINTAQTYHKLREKCESL